MASPVSHLVRLGLYELLCWRACWAGAAGRSQGAINLRHCQPSGPKRYSFAQTEQGYGGGRNVFPDSDILYGFQKARLLLGCSQLRIPQDQ